MLRGFWGIEMCLYLSVFYVLGGVDGWISYVDNCVNGQRVCLYNVS
jgi:hypothetical protein